MADHADLILTLTGGLAMALAFGLFAKRIGLSPIVGYLLAGIAVGPFTPGFVAHHELAAELAEIGVILLMFGVGLHFDVKDLLAVRKIALPGALIQIFIATILGALVGRAAGWTWSASLVFGVALSVASTVVMTRVLAEERLLDSPTGHLAIGWLVLEDVFTVLCLVMLPALHEGGSSGGAWAAAVSLVVALVKLGILTAFTLVVGRQVIPALLGFVVKTGSAELFTLSVLVVALGIAVGSARFFGASMALGAFLAGMVVGQTNHSARAASDALPMRDAFAVLFFVSVGMLLDPKALVVHWRVTALALAVVLFAKPAASIAVVSAFRRPLATALAVGLAIGQIGEFSFILAAEGQRIGLIPAEAMQVLVATAIVSITVNPLMFGLRDRIARSLS